LRIGLAFDIVPAENDRDAGGLDDRYEEFDKPETIEAIAAALRAGGHRVELLGDGPELIRRLLERPPEFVWNLAEGQGVGRAREARVPAVLEMLGIPYSGSDPFTLAAALDKDVARRLVSQCVRVPKGLALPADMPRHAVAPALAHFFDFDAGEGPLILKPAFEGSSKGIRSGQLAETAEAAAELFEKLAEGYEQPILVEQFIAGDEVTVGIIGNGAAAEVVGTMRIAPRQPCERFVYSLDVKRHWEEMVVYEVPAPLAPPLLAQVEESALAAFHCLGCRDLARIDFRVHQGVPYFLEANPLPGLAPRTSDLVILADHCGIGHAALIGRILQVSLERVGLAQPEPVAP
jgi:D-alanine-D-alanine ligase